MTSLFFLGLWLAPLRAEDSHLCTLGAADYQQCVAERCLELNQQGALCEGRLRSGVTPRQRPVYIYSPFYPVIYIVPSGCGLSITPTSGCGLRQGVMPINPPLAAPLQPSVTIQPMPRVGP